MTNSKMPDLGQKKANNLPFFHLLESRFRSARLFKVIGTTNNLKNTIWHKGLRLFLVPRLFWVTQLKQLDHREGY